MQLSSRSGYVCLCGVISVLGSAYAVDMELPQRERFHIFVLAGQSNMAGRGEVEPVDKKPHPRVLTLTESCDWAPAVAPIHFDKTGAGVGPGRTFGIAVAEALPETVIGLVPCATGGSPIEVWQPGKYWHQTDSHPYDDAIRRAKRAMKDGVLEGILWHQGEGDSKPARAGAYAENLTGLIARFRRDLGVPDLPFIIGQLGRFSEAPWNEEKKLVDKAHRTVAERDPHVIFVSAEGLGCKEDLVHFDARSQRELGRRFASAYLDLIGTRAE